MKNLLLLTSLLLLLSACASPYPLGMNKEQWRALSADERKAMLLKQQEHQEKQRMVQIKANAKAEQLRLENQIIESRRLEKLYSNPQDGNVIMLNILGGQYHYGKRVKNVLEASYQIARGETKKIKLIIKDPNKNYTSTETVFLHYDHTGNGVYLYLDNPSYNKYKRIALLRDGHWLCGSQYKKNLNYSNEKLMGMKLFVKESGNACHSNHYRPYR
ncbi:MAG: hypothetical protein ISEC1_P0859 [Thiomicrorhabdus sp.]|nr:MAG: hypothetical protein ISEC1_P0859 [Thiomicrorhabdus sp.]